MLFALLLAEISITLWDFIEEDNIRRLPAGERAMHAVMGIVYGAFLASLILRCQMATLPPGSARAITGSPRGCCASWRPASSSPASATSWRGRSGASVRTISGLPAVVLCRGRL